MFDIPAGVPQGSILAPFLFNIFVNVIINPKNSELFMYADDTAVTCDSTWKNLRTIKKNLENALDKLTEYFASWKIKINDSKTEFIMFSKSTKMLKKLNSDPLRFRNQTLSWTPNVRYLGFTLDNKLTYKSHIDLAIKKARKLMSVLFCLIKKNNQLKPEHKVHVYKAYIRPVLTYGEIVYHNCAKTNFSKIQVLQNKCLRMALDSPFFTKNSQLHEDAKIPTINDFIKKKHREFLQ